jgi:hypothetical protein
MIKNRGFVKNLPNFFGVRTGFVVMFGDAMTAPSCLRTFWLGVVGVHALTMLTAFIYFSRESLYL